MLFLQLHSQTTYTNESSATVDKDWKQFRTVQGKGRMDHL